MLFVNQVKNTVKATLFLYLLAAADYRVNAQENTATAETHLSQVSINDVGSGQLLFKTNSEKFLQAPNLTTTADINVKGIVANTHIQQTFTNTTNEWQHAVYVFPLPDNAAVNRLSIKMGEREIVGIVKEKSSAKRIFKQAQKAGKKAALIEQYRANLFSTQVANIPPQQSITVSLSYFQQVAFEANTFSLHFPMAITPRYTPKANTDKDTFEAGQAFFPETRLPGLAFNSNSQFTDKNTTHQVPPRELAKIDLTLSLDSGASLKAIKSLNHPVVIKQQETGKFALNLTQQVLDKDFEIQWQYQAQKLPQILNFSEKHRDKHYGLLMILPGFNSDVNSGIDSGLNKQNSSPDRELTFVLDKSGSMDGQSIKDAKSAFKFALDTLSKQDTFQLITFNNHADEFFEYPVAATDFNKQTAWQFVKNIQANGGTEIKSSLALALKKLNAKSRISDNERLSQIVFLTDGAVGNEAEIFNMIDKHIGQQRLFTVGLGTAPNRYFMNKAAEAGRGSYQYIGSTRELIPEMSKLFNKLDSPILTDINLQLNNHLVNISTSPNPITDVYADEPIFISYQVDNSQLKKTVQSAEVNAGIDAEISAKYLTKPWQLTIKNLVGNDKPDTLKTSSAMTQPVFANDSNSVIPALATLWARRKIDDHYRQFMLYRDSSAKQKIIDLALNFNLVTPFTSLVAVEQKISRPQHQRAKNKQLSNNLPAGQKMPKTALNWQLQVSISILLLLIASLIFIAMKFQQINAQPK